MVPDDTPIERIIRREAWKQGYLQAIEDAAKVIDSIPMGYAHPPGNVTEKELANARLKYAAAIRSLKPTNEGKG